MSAFDILIKKYPHTREDVNTINHSSGIYLFFNLLHLPENIENNLISSRRFVFPHDEVEKEDEFYDGISLDAVEITWKLLRDVYDKDENLPSNLKLTS